MIKQRKKLSMLVAIMMFIALVTSIPAAYASNGGANSQSDLGRINLDNNGYVVLSNVQMIASQNQKTFAYTIKVVNNGTRDLDFYDYWTRIRLNNGSNVSVKPFGNRADDKIAPQTEKQYTFYTMVNSNTKYSDVTIQILKWDFNQTDFTRILGSIRIPANYDPASGANVVTVDNTELQISYNNVKQSHINENVKIEFDTEFLNTGSRAITIPAFKYYIENKNGLLYELSADNGKSIQQAQPKGKAKIRLKGEVAESVELDNAKLIIAQFDQQTNVEIPAATVYIDLTPTVSSDTSLSVSTEKPIVIDDNTYHLKLESVQQLPWEDENIISALVTVTNKNREALPLPDLKAVFSFDGVELGEQDTNIVKLDNGIGIPAGQKVRYAVFVRIPYTYTYSKVGVEFLAVTKDGGDSYEEELLSYSVPKTAFKGFTPVLAGATYNTTTSGKSAAYLVKNLNVYEGKNTTVYNVTFEVENTELRTRGLTELIGYFKTANGTMYPADISKAEVSLSPSSKVLLSASAKIPNWANTTDLHLVLGELDSANQAYYSAAEFRLPLASTVDNVGNMKDKEIYPYTFSINSLSVVLSSDAEVKFQYTLEKTQEYEYTPEDHSIVMELVDGDVKYTQEFAFERDLKLGTNWGSMIANMNIENPQHKLITYKGFKINVYDQYQGHKKLIISRDISLVTVR